MSDHHSFSADAIFVKLLILTLAEVLWGVFVPLPRPIIWIGLMAFAGWKGYLIFFYFMHMKFEGPIVKGMIFVTPFLAAVAVFAWMPDTSFNKQLNYPIGHQADRIDESGYVVPMEDWNNLEGFGPTDDHGGGH